MPGLSLWWVPIVIPDEAQRDRDRQARALPTQFGRGGMDPPTRRNDSIEVPHRGRCLGHSQSDPGSAAAVRDDAAKLTRS